MALRHCEVCAKATVHPLPNSKFTANFATFYVPHAKRSLKCNQVEPASLTPSKTWELRTRTSKMPWMTLTEGKREITGKQRRNRIASE